MELEGVKRISPIISDLMKNYGQLDIANAVGFLIKLLSNIEKNPLDAKYRKIKTTNKTLKAKVFSISGIEEILKAIGFTLEGDFYVFNQQSITPVNQGLIILRAREVQLRAVRTGELTEVQKQRMEELKRQKRQQEEQMSRIMDGAKNDRQDYKKRETDRVYRDSKSNKLNFGANVMTAQEVMPQGGGG